jgi:hypothetical protein
VACYRLYFLDGFTGRVDHSREFEAESDDSAIAIAEQWQKLSAMELWCQQRKVRSWDNHRYAIGVWQ